MFRPQARYFTVRMSLQVSIWPSRAGRFSEQRRMAIRHGRVWCMAPKGIGANIRLSSGQSKVFSSMADRWETTTGSYSFRFFSSEQVDQILCDGAKRGRAGSHAAIERILKLEPEVKRAELWRRIRQLKYPSRATGCRRSAWSAEDDRILTTGYEKGWSGKQATVRELLKRHPDWRPHVIWRRAAKLGLTAGIAKSRQGGRALRWSDNDDRTLLDHAGYDRVDVIGELLNRSANAVRCRLSRLRESGRVSDGYTRKGLANFLHVSPRVVLRWIMLGWLKVRDSRISMPSLETFSMTHAPQLTLGEPRFLALGSSNSRAGYTWAKVAKHFRASPETVQDWISRGWLKFCDPHITERSFEEFCRKHGSEINYELLGKDTQVWLVESMGLVRAQRNGEGGEVRSACKQALKIRNCEGCRRPIRGNAFFRHIRSCPQLAVKTKSSQG